MSARRQEKVPRLRGPAGRFARDQAARFLRISQARRKAWDISSAGTAPENSTWPCKAKLGTPWMPALRAMKGESKYYVSLAHTRADIDHTIGAWTEAIAELKR